ncbi:MAG: UDP-2,3-diacylglucosamine pyrophosphatase LpxH [Cryomorphaceae bacterium]|jgi:UDP-2,3-diacylglucosamine pyrophosphatase LpxH/glycosyltransferase involved in cell wall biosynthesis
MRIEIVTDTFPPDVNGVAMTLGKLTENLKQSGHYVHIVHTGEEVKLGETKIKSMALPGYKAVRVGLPSPMQLRKRWKHKRPDVIYVATESPLGISAIKAARELNIPVASGFHTNFHQYLKDYKLRKIERPVLALLRKVHNKCDCTMVPSQDILTTLDSVGFKNLRLLGRGIDTEQFHIKRRSELLRSSWGASVNTPVAIIVGRVAAEKNLEFALSSLEQVKVTMPDLRIVVVGDGPLKDKLREKYPESNGFHFAGVHRGESLAMHYASADLLVFASESETFGNVLLEGMASGNITVSYRYAASAQYIENGINGYNCELGNKAEFQSILVTALNHYRNQKIKGAGIETIKPLTWKSITDTFSKHLKEIIADKPIIHRRIKNKTKLNYRSLFLSDIHLGTEDAKARQVLDVIKNVNCERLYLNGDIIDGWALKRKAKWKKSHSKVVRAILKKSEQDDCEVIYTRGNHDDFMTHFLPIDVGGLKIVKEAEHVCPNGDKYLVIHGDGFDSVCTNHRWLASIGALSYDFLLKVNRYYNTYRSWRGKEYFSISKAIKSKVKTAVSFVDNYEDKLHDLASSRGYKGIICGHIHTPADKMVKETHYLNSGDWVETMSCIVEHYDGRMELLFYKDLLERFSHERGPEVSTRSIA